MPNTNIKFLNYSDNQDQLVSKLNNNFDEVVEFHGGSQGLTGPVGDRGAIGEIGEVGTVGNTGTRGTRWFVNSGAPAGTGNYAIIGDYWLNSSSGEVYEFTESGWSDTGYNFNSSGTIFNQSESSYDPSIGGTGYVVYQGQIDPSKYGFVVSDTTPEAVNLNPLLAKFLVSTDNLRNPSPLMEFSKTNVENGTVTDYSQHPIFKWEDFNSTNNSMSLEIPGGSFTIGASGGYEASFDSLNVNSQASVSISAGVTSGSGIYSTGGFQLNTPTGSFNFISKYFSVTGGSGSFSNPVNTTVALQPSDSSTYIYSGGTSGFRTSRTGDTFDGLSHSVYNVKLENQDGAQFYLDTKGKLKTGKVDEGLTYPDNSIFGATGTVSSNLVEWFLVSIPGSPSPYTPLSSGNTFVFSPSKSGSLTSSYYAGIAIYTGSDYGWGTTGGILPGQSITMRIYCGSDTYSGYWNHYSDSASYSGIQYIGSGTTGGVSNIVNLGFKSQAIDLTLTRGVTGSVTTVYYKAYNLGIISGIPDRPQIKSGFFSF